jgi:hypothetical protein
MASCQRADDPDGAQLNQLTARVTALEQRQFQLQRALEKKQDDSGQLPATAITLWRFQGEEGAVHKYATKERCDAALQAFQADRAAADAAKGVTVVRGTEPACTPA